MNTVTELNGRHVQSGSNGEVLRILHIEDSAADRILVREGLAREGIRCEIRGVSTREEFLSGIAEGPYEMVISDSSLPSFSGAEAFEIVRTRYPDAAFLVYSGNITEESRRTATAAIPKGRISELAAAIRQTIRPERPLLEQILGGLQWPAAARCLAAALESDTDIGILAFDQERRITVWNDEMVRLYGLSSQEALSKPVTEIFTSLGRNGEDLLMYSIVNGVPMTWRESSHTHRIQKTPMVTIASFIPLGDAKSTPAGGIVLTKDRTTHKRMVQAEMMVENAFRSAVESAADAILVVDAGGKIRYANKKLCRMTGADSADLTSRSFLELLSPEASKMWQATLPDLLRIIEASLPLRIRVSTGGFFEAEASAAVISGGRIVVVLRDISDKVAECQELRHSKDFFQSLADGAGEVVLSISADQRVNYVNSSFTAMTGWSKWVWLGRELSSLVHPDDMRLWTYGIETAMSGNPGPVFHLRMRCADGRYFRGECKCSPSIQGGKVTGTWQIIRNIDEPFFPDETSVREFKQISEHYVS